MYPPMDYTCQGGGKTALFRPPPGNLKILRNIDPNWKILLFSESLKYKRLRKIFWSYLKTYKIFFGKDEKNLFVKISFFLI